MPLFVVTDPEIDRHAPRLSRESSREQGNSMTFSYVQSINRLGVGDHVMGG